MKKFIIYALCALLAIHSAEARTLYVNAKRPNNKGNGLNVKSAKKTLQAAINIAKKGDTILVYPGTYSPIKTKNKKITLKSVKGRSKTKIVWNKGYDDCADLSKPVRKYNSKYGYYYTMPTGNATSLSGFTLDGNGYAISAVTGGTLICCTIRKIGRKYSSCYDYIVKKSNLSGCLVKNNSITTMGLFYECTVKTTKITENKYALAPLSWGFHSVHFDSGSIFVNCLIANNSSYGGFFGDSTLLNCTVADNAMPYSYVSRDDGYGLFAWSSQFDNCILRNNYSQNCSEQYGPWVLHNVDSGNTYKNTDTTNKNPRFTSAYKLKMESYAIDKGKLTKTQKKLVGTKDLAGRKRIRGKAIDRGCYEY